MPLLPAAYTRRDRRALRRMAVVVLTLHLLGFGLLLTYSLAGHPAHLSHPALTLGVGLLAYTFGLRHAFDADHIAAIDNTTRKLAAETSGRPLTVGFWFSLGHASVVFVLCAALAAGMRSLAGDVRDPHSHLHQITSVIGTSVSAAFLLLLAAVNAVTLRKLVHLIRPARQHQLDPAALATHLHERGLLARLLQPLIRTVRKPVHLYPVGLLFGLGFDTATEVGLLVLAGTTAAVNLPWYGILALPLLFAAGMSLADSVNGVLMNLAYGWADRHPARQLYYNLTVTTISVLTAAVIGTVELATVLAAHTNTPVIRWLSQLPMTYTGYAVTVVFLSCWAISAVLWKWRFGQRWTRHPSSVSGGSDSGEAVQLPITQTRVSDTKTAVTTLERS